MTASRKVLLIGGAGFMGRHVSASLRADGHDVTVLGRTPRALPDGVHALVADRGDTASLAAALEGRGFDLTVDFLVFDRPDIERLYLVPHARLGLYVMISSGQTYLVTEGATAPYREDAADGPLVPEPPAGTYDHANWRYGVGKRRAEQALFSLRATHGLRAIALRLPIVQGEGDGSLRLWGWIERLRDGGPIVVPDAGVRPVRHVWAGDVARAIAWLASHGDPQRAVYNLAQPDIVSFREWLDRLARLLGVTPEIVDASWEELLAAGFEQRCLPYVGGWASVPDPGRIAEEWGLLTTPLDTYLPEVVRAHLERPPGRSDEGYVQRPLELEFARGRAGRG